MKFQRTLAAVVALVAIGAAPALGQNRGAAMLERQPAFVDTVVVQLEMPVEQEKAFRAIMTEQLEGMQAIFKKYEGQRDPQMREDVTALRSETDKKLATVLSEDQMAAFITMRDEHRAQYRRGRQPAPGDQMPAGDTASAMTPGQGGPGRARMMERLRAEGDEMTIELVARSETAHLKAREAMQAGDQAAAQLHRQEAHGYMFTAVKRTFPEMANRMRHGKNGEMKGCGGMRGGGAAGQQGGGQGMMHGKGQGQGQGKCRAQEV